MELSLTEAARLLGKSERQMRYLIQEARIPGRKVHGHWVIRREDLPLSEGQVQAARQKTERAARLAEEILRPEEEGSPKSHSIRQLRAYQVGAPLYRDLVEKTGADHPATGLMREALMLLACGYHEFESHGKAEHYGRARQQASRAVMALLIEDEESHRGLVERLETSFLPALGGLIHQAERRGRRR